MEQRSLFKSMLSYASTAVMCFCMTTFLTNASAEYTTATVYNDSIFSEEIKYPEKLIPLGSAVGIKMYSNGMIVAGISEVETANGTVSPLKEAGIEVGDVILKINDVSITSGNDLENIISSSNGQPMTVEFERDGETHSVTVTPRQSNADQKYRIGAWVRDSMAGVGTVTFVDPSSRTFGALGHGVCDVDTGRLVPLLSGSVMPAEVAEVKNGTPGDPGELRCVFDVKNNIGSIISNTNQGIFGILNDDSLYANFESLPIADRSEIEPGQAFIYSTVEGNQPKQYEIEIVKVYSGQRADGKNMLIKVVDQDLIDKTGGIVQGMSGSPIVQNGKIIGAVTHVLVNDPKKGYGIFIENMLDRAYCKDDETQDLVIDEELQAA